jgi:hypothetical protein
MNEWYKVLLGYQPHQCSVKNQLETVSVSITRVNVDPDDGSPMRILQYI